MRSEPGLSGQRDLTFTDATRRAQIVTAAIDTIAEFGYGQASLARIAERDPQVMAVAIRGAIDHVPSRLARDPSLDVDRYARELAALFDLATRGEPQRPEGARP
jgi:hypothetical protein